MGKIDVRRVKEHYVIYVDEEFYCTCENMREVDEEITDIKNYENA